VPPITEWQLQFAIRSSRPILPEQSLLKFNKYDENISATWRELVELYTTLKFTKASDLLPALAGIVEREIARRGCDAYAGCMWKDSILEDLGFYIYGQGQGVRISSRAVRFGSEGVKSHRAWNYWNFPSLVLDDPILAWASTRAFAYAVPFLQR
jgi:hypothetical protein